MTLNGAVTTDMRYRYGSLIGGWRKSGSNSSRTGDRRVSLDDWHSLTTKRVIFRGCRGSGSVQGRRRRRRRAVMSVDRWRRITSTSPLSSRSPGGLAILIGRTNTRTQRGRSSISARSVRSLTLQRSYTANNHRKKQYRRALDLLQRHNQEFSLGSWLQALWQSMEYTCMIFDCPTLVNVSTYLTEVRRLVPVTLLDFSLLRRRFCFTPRLSLCLSVCLFVRLLATSYETAVFLWKFYQTW